MIPTFDNPELARILLGVAWTLSIIGAMAMGYMLGRLDR